MKKIIYFLLFIICANSILVFSQTGTYILFQPNAQVSYLHFLRLDHKGQFMYYEFTISNMQCISISLTDSVFGKWFHKGHNVCLYSNRYLKSESKEIRNIYRILPVKSLVGDSLMLTKVDDCTLKHPELYRQFKCVDVVFPDSLDKKLMFSIINNITIDERKEGITLTDDSDDE